MRNILKIGLSTTLATLLFTGCMPSPCSNKPSKEALELQKFSQELNVYAAESYKNKGANCTDYSIKQLDLLNLRDNNLNDLTIEIKDNKPLIAPGMSRGTSLSKNRLIDILDKKEDIKRNIDLYIDSCSKKTRK